MRSAARLILLFGLMSAWALAAKSRHVLALDGTVSSSRGEAVAVGRMGDGDEGKPAGPHDLSALRVFTRVILYVKDNYVDPQRIKPKEMMVAALEYVEKSVPDVMADGTAESGKLKLNVNGQVKEFDISGVDSMWKMTFQLKDIFQFVQKNMRRVEDTREIEYAAVNGMLQTLDPHSILMRPEMYREMKLQTKGEFGGLGFVIQMREGNLTVVKVLPKTPAFRAGIKKDDQIRKIGEESTVNMDLNEAVSKLRGVPGTKVVITVERKAWDKPQVLTLARAIIAIESVQSKLLSSNVAYIRVKNFQGNTTRDIQNALADMEEQAQSKGGPIKGLVLDMRGNPGGLLEQAIQVSDLFLSDGTIVATVGLSDKLREEKKAQRSAGDDAYPIAVLVNAGSASASEIVAGALKNLNRAVIIGQQTFGKGSVQVLYDFPDESALKLTIAKYLTPGDVSIQEIGIVPDIELIPTRVSKERVDAFAPRRSMGEADLDRHFGNPSNDKAVKKRDDVVLKEKPLESVKYVKDEKPAAPEKVAKVDEKAPVKGAPKVVEKNPLTDADVTHDEDLYDQLDAEAQDEVKEDYEVRFARDFVLTAPFKQRQKMLSASRTFVGDKRREEEARLASAIAAMGVDWSAGPTPAKVDLVGTVKPGADKKIPAGETFPLELTVENRGPEPLKRVRGWTESDNGFLDRREFVLGALKPGEKRSWSVQVKTPKDLLSRRDGVVVKLQDDNGPLAATVTGDVNFGEFLRPRFAFNYQVIDTCPACNGDGLASRGESLALLVDVTNVGAGKAPDSFASIKNVGEANIFIEKGRFKLGEVAPGETKTALFRLEVKKAFEKPTFALRLSILDEPLEEYAGEKLEIPVTPDDAPPVALDARKASVVRLGEKAELYAAADLARSLGKATKGAVLSELARGASVAKVEIAKDRFAFVKLAQIKDVKGVKPAALKDLDRTQFRAAPHISLNVDPMNGGTVTEGDHFSLSGIVESPTLLDVFVLVNDQKVYFKGAGADDAGKLKFTSDFALKEGNNVVAVVARESQDFAARKVLVIRRKPTAVAVQTPSTAPAVAKP